MTAHGVTAHLTAADLDPGDEVSREAVVFGRRRRTVRTAVPCCGQPLLFPYTEPDPDGNAGETPAVCCRCGLVYLVALQPDPDSFAWDEPVMPAVFTVMHAGAFAAQHRRTR